MVTIRVADHLGGGKVGRVKGSWFGVSEAISLPFPRLIMQKPTLCATRKIRCFKTLIFFVEKEKEDAGTEFLRCPHLQIKHGIFA